MANTPKADMITSFSAGEFTPALAGHIDFEAYKSGSRFIENLIPEVQGGLKKFYGTREIAVLTNPGNYVMVPFDGLDAPVVLVIHDGIISVVDGDDYYDTELTVSVTDVRRLDWVQQNSVIYFVHPMCMPFEVRHLGRDTETNKMIFSISECSFVDVPYFPIEWNGNFNGTVKTDGEDGTIVVETQTTVSCRLKIPDILASSSGTVDVLIGPKTATLNYDKSPSIGNTTVSIIRIRDGVETVVASVGNTGIIHTAGVSGI